MVRNGQAIELASPFAETMALGDRCQVLWAHAVSRFVVSVAANSVLASISMPHSDDLPLFKQFLFHPKQARQSFPAVKKMIAYPIQELPSELISTLERRFSVLHLLHNSQ